MTRLLLPASTAILLTLRLLAVQVSPFGRDSVRGLPGMPLLLLRSPSRLDSLGPGVAPD